MITFGYKEHYERIGRTIRKKVIEEKVLCYMWTETESSGERGVKNEKEPSV